MISTRQEFASSDKSVFLIDNDLAQDLYRATKNPRLKELLGKTKILIKSDLQQEIVQELEAQKERMSNARQQRKGKGKGGRPRLPELSEWEVERLPPLELKRYKERMWQRDWRKRKNDSI
jgi:hypothetical protein